MPSDPPHPPVQTRPTGDRRAELEKIKARMANRTPEEIERDLKAWRERAPWPYPIDSALIKWIAEDPDLEDINW